MPETRPAAAAAAGAGCVPRRRRRGSLRTIAALALLLAGVAPGRPARAAGLDAKALLVRLDAVPAVTGPAPATKPGAYVVTSKSGAFSLILPVSGVLGRRGLPTAATAGGWNIGNQAATPGGPDSAFDLKVEHAPDGSWIKGQVTALPRAGIESALRAEASYAKELVDAAPAHVTRDVSFETYRASELHCGTLRHSRVGHTCSLVHVVVHGDRMVRLHSLIIAEDDAQRDELVEQFAAALGSLMLHPRP